MNVMVYSNISIIRLVIRKRDKNLRLWMIMTKNYKWKEIKTLMIRMKLRIINGIPRPSLIIET